MTRERRPGRTGAVPGRPLAGANAALPRPDEPHLVLRQAATVPRAHRGDGHVAALVAAGLDPVASLVSVAAVGAAPVATAASRGRSDDAWGVAAERPVRRGLLDGGGTAAESGRALRARIERRTDASAAAPWAALGTDATNRPAGLLGDVRVAVPGTGLLPATSTLGIGRV